MSSYREFMRRKLLEEMYDKLSPEEKRTFLKLTMQEKDHVEIMNALKRQKEDLEIIKSKQNWKTDFLSDVGANLFTDGLIWIGSKIIRKL